MPGEIQRVMIRAKFQQTESLCGGSDELSSDGVFMAMLEEDRDMVL